MNKTDNAETRQHNEKQIAYFSASLKKNMVPRPSSYHTRHAEELYRFAGLRNGDRVLEVGCGMGQYSFPLAEKGIRLEGLDLTPFLLEMFEKYNDSRYHIPLHCSDIRNAPEELYGKFDAVIGFFTLHHIKELEESIAAIYRLLRPGGTMTFLEPNAFNPLYYIQILLKPGMSWSAEKELVNMRDSVIAPSVTKAGFQDYQTRKFGFFPPFIANNRFGGRLETILEKVALFYPFLPFQIFKATKQESPFSLEDVNVIRH